MWCLIRHVLLFAPPLFSLIFFRSSTSHHFKSSPQPRERFQKSLPCTEWTLTQNGLIQACQNPQFVLGPKNGLVSRMDTLCSCWCMCLFLMSVVSLLVSILWLTLCFLLTLLSAFSLCVSVLILLPFWFPPLLNKTLVGLFHSLFVRTGICRQWSCSPWLAVKWCHSLLDDVIRGVGVLASCDVTHYWMMSSEG